MRLRRALLEGYTVNRLWRILIAVLLAATLLGCKPHEVARVYGTYLANYSAATESLTLKPDGTFVQSVTLHSHSKPVTSTGHWRFDQPTAFVIFDSGYIEVLDAFGRPRPDYAQPLAGVVDMPVVRCLGHLYIGTARFVLYAQDQPRPNALAAKACSLLF
jgi:hypothetical protein